MVFGDLTPENRAKFPGALAARFAVQFDPL